MTNPDSKKTAKVIFPENITSVISEIVKKYNILENDKDAVRKILNGETTKIEELAGIIKKLAMDEISLKNLPATLKKDFNISVEDSKRLAGEIEEKVLPLAQRFSEEKEISVKPEVVKKPQPPKTETLMKKDIYREPAE